MSWIEIAAIVVFLMGIGAGGFLVAQRPTFWVGLGAVLLKAALPFILKRMSPQDEAAWHEAERQGRGDEWLRNRWKRRPPS